MTAQIAHTTGRRKRAVARVRVRIGTGTITVNGRSIEDFFPSDSLFKKNLTNAFLYQLENDSTGASYFFLSLFSSEEQKAYDIDATIHGGGSSGQAGALRLGIARALVDIDSDFREGLKKSGFLTRDSRKKESKKYGLKKARKAPQYSKR